MNVTRSVCSRAFKVRIDNWILYIFCGQHANVHCTIASKNYFVASFRWWTLIRTAIQTTILRALSLCPICGPVGSFILIWDMRRTSQITTMQLNIWIKRLEYFNERNIHISEERNFCKHSLMCTTSKMGEKCRYLDHDTRLFLNIGQSLADHDFLGPQGIRLWGLYMLLTLFNSV